MGLISFFIFISAFANTTPVKDCWLNLVPPQKFVEAFEMLYTQNMIDELASNPQAALIGFKKLRKQLIPVQLKENLENKLFKLNHTLTLDLDGLHIKNEGVEISHEGAKLLLNLHDQIANVDLLVKPQSVRDSESALEKAWQELHAELVHTKELKFETPTWKAINLWVTAGDLQSLVINLGLKPFLTLTKDSHHLEKALKENMSPLDREILFLQNNQAPLFEELGRLGATVFYLEKMLEAKSFSPRSTGETLLTQARTRFAEHYLFLNAKLQ